MAPPPRAKTVSALRERPRGRVAVELDGEPWRVVPTAAVVRAGLAVGTTLDRSAARTLGRELRRARALTRATRALAVRDRSRSELDERLERAGVSAEIRDEALETLERAGFLDDARVARSRAEALAERGYGDAAIRADLERQRVAGAVVAEALAGLDRERDRAERLVGRYGRDPKTWRRLAMRGFAPETIADVAGFADEG